MTKRDEALTELVAGTVDSLDFERELTPGVRLLGVSGRWQSRQSSEFRSPGYPMAELTYLVHNWTVHIESGNLLTSSPPASVTIDTESKDVRAKGITTEIMRAVPLADARRRIKAIARAYLDEQRESSQDFGRMRGDQDWARFANMYARLVAGGELSPVAHLARALKISRNTAAARVRIAREKGFLTRPTDESLGELTEKAHALLGEAD